MAPLPLVLIHGGGFSASCWDPTIPHLADPVLAIDLPGRGRHPTPLVGLTIDDFADSALADIDEAGLDRVILVGHSMAGVTMPGLAARLGDRCAGIIFVACTVPPDGGTIIDTLPSDFQDTVRATIAAAVDKEPDILDPDRAFEIFGNGLTGAMWTMCLRMMTREVPGISMETVDISPYYGVERKMWVLCTDDAICLPDNQRRFAGYARTDIVELDASHMAMIQRPVQLAATLEAIRNHWS